MYVITVCIVDYNSTYEYTVSISISNEYIEYKLSSLQYTFYIQFVYICI